MAVKDFATRVNGKLTISSWDELLALDPELVVFKLNDNNKTKVIHKFVIKDSCAGSHTFSLDINSAFASFINFWEKTFNSIPVFVTNVDSDGQRRELTSEEVNEYLPHLANVYATHVLIFLLKEIHPAMEKAFHAAYHVALDRALRHVGTRMESSLRAYGTEAEAINTIFQTLGKEIKDQLGITSGGSQKKVVATDEQAKKFARDYPAILKHWKDIKGWRKKYPERWRNHAKVEHCDTPDDLLDLLEMERAYESAPYRLAHYHAARRAGIQTEIKRRGKLKLCSYETLNTILKRGKKLQ